ncbi:hypothetical protein SARC_00577 [Sphaeroforma arctica JP610]|uniref:Uncharacterized protein n=1 Tax=Sphaeroforma arctica JP610 TaxID=667725 RepID=A0A0L0GEI4_9EUKA|nr:hypothetical protein SARC_00577 [Sphaeroforma arctica JP610]KNC87296.1 hypothetical protein SARC_00577 [Sphaeroforma arctica JP610]|eukprot:XP_014161198.1 hypothetical protein SARC_00577 [Sphaeroforma arctica JP610]
MSMIHYGEKELAARRLLLEEMYEHVLSMLHAHREVNMYLFVIYTLFSLTETQILKPRVPVMVDARTWNLLVEFHRTNSTLPSRSDVQRVFNIMVQQRSFTFGVRDKTLIRYPIGMSSVLGYRNTGIPLSELQNSYADYEDALGEVDANGAVDELSHYNPEFPQDLKTELQKYWVAFVSTPKPSYRNIGSLL